MSECILIKNILRILDCVKNIDLLGACSFLIDEKFKHADISCGEQKWLRFIFGACDISKRIFDHLFVIQCIPKRIFVFAMSVFLTCDHYI